MKMTDTLDPARAAALHATLGLSGRVPKAGDALPAFWHYIYFWDAQKPEALGRDGHPKTGGFIPDLGLPRRMWAGGHLQFTAPLRLGMPATKTSKIVDIAEKTGSTGPLAIVSVDHQISQDGKVCVAEKQSLIYREAADPAQPNLQPPIAPKDEVFSEVHDFTTTQLFRYSALTFNGHRIHYDQAYARTCEGYPDLIVHGPLLAQLLIHFAENHIGKLNGFTFKATSPLFVTEAATLCAKPNEDGLDLWVRGPKGKLSMTAKAF